MMLATPPAPARRCWSGKATCSDPLPLAAPPACGAGGAGVGRRRRCQAPKAKDALGGGDPRLQHEGARGAASLYAARVERGAVIEIGDDIFLQHLAPARVTPDPAAMAVDPLHPRRLEAHMVKRAPLPKDRPRVRRRYSGVGAAVPDGDDRPRTVMRRGTTDRRCGLHLAWKIPPTHGGEGGGN